MAGYEFALGSLMVCPLDRKANTPASKKLLCTREVFRPSIKEFFYFSEGLVSYEAPAGTEACLFVNKRYFPEGLNLLTFELLNFSKHAVDLSFEFIIEYHNGIQTRLNPFELNQGKRLPFGFCLEFFSHITALRFNNLSAANSSSFALGCLMLRD
jgi:hypothetical protein